MPNGHSSTLMKQLACTRFTVKGLKHFTTSIKGKAMLARWFLLKHSWRSNQNQRSFLPTISLMANIHHLFIAHILFRQIQPEESQYHQSFLPLHGHETAVYDFASLVLPSFIVNGQYDVQFFNFTPVILPSSGCHSQHFFHHWFIGTAIFSLYLSFYQYSCYKDPHYDLPDLVKMSVGEQRCKAYIRQSQIIVNTTNCHQATILQLRTSLLSCTCFGSSKACIAFSRNHSAEYCGLSRVLPVFMFLVTGNLSPFLRDEDCCSSCKIYLQKYFGSSAVFVILVVFGQWMIPCFYLTTVSQVCCFLFINGRVSLIYNHSPRSFVSPRCSGLPQHFSMPTCFCVAHSCCSSSSKDSTSGKPLGRNIDGRTYKAHTVADRQAAFHAAEENTEAVLAAQIEEITAHLSASVLADNVSGPSLVPGGPLWSRNSSEDHQSDDYFPTSSSPLFMAHHSTPSHLSSSQSLPTSSHSPPHWYDWRLYRHGYCNFCLLFQHK